ncbi:MAG: PhzF family phenazine biosynthesis protein [Gemmatimonadota bacterium]|nr:MAG: PhzF family phenazine biosynthesis protein [Gemmatimonadota bacterium]
MGEHTFSIVDVFAERKYAGNQLAVFEDAQDLSDSEMQRFAKEMNYSETTFILSGERGDGGYDVRIFTPEEEIPFAGHPTLGTAFVIQHEIMKKPVEQIILNLQVGQIPVTFDYRGGEPDMLRMKQKEPVFGEVFDRRDVVDILGLREDDIDDRFPVQTVSTGLPFMIVPMKNLASVKKSCIVQDKYFELIRDSEAKDILIFCPETYSRDNDLNVRVFAGYHGVPEDPATGSANGCLAGYLVKHRYLGEDRIDLRVEQGYEMGRPSLLFLNAEEKKSGIEVFVGGRVFMVARGKFV